jgi:hypothetical protein
VKRHRKVILRGRTSEWAVEAMLSQEQIDAMTEDGIEVIEVQSRLPMWVVTAGLASIWCFFQDLWNFRNPFRT